MQTVPRDVLGDPSHLSALAGYYASCVGKPLTLTFWCVARTRWDANAGPMPVYPEQRGPAREDFMCGRRFLRPHHRAPHKATSNVHNV